ncbi:MAG TPA: low molecular weight protein-tyrosine-phosphatase [Polyangiaceae bacterium]|nr:low molecular weight protein-tyrosine-phosphatase [Polyangiaceae bacterium]
MLRICFVCLGNICRSPIAEGVMSHLVQAAGLQNEILVDSAGTAGYHEGEPPDARAVAAAARRGIALHGRARQLRQGDYDSFDYLLAMDRSNLEHLLSKAPRSARSKIRLLRSYEAGADTDAPVRDPYYGSASDFDEVVDVCMAACSGLLASLRESYRL